MKNPNSLSLTSQKRWSRPLAIFMIVFWTHWTSPCLFCPSDPQAGGSTPGRFSQEWNPQEDYLPYFAGQTIQSGYDWLSGLQVSIASLWKIVHPPVCQVLLCGAALSIRVCMDTGHCSDAGTHGHRILTLLDFMMFTWAHTTTCPKVPLEGISSLQQINHSAWCHVKTCYGCTWSCRLCPWQRY